MADPAQLQCTALPAVETCLPRMEAPPLPAEWELLQHFKIALGMANRSERALLVKVCMLARNTGYCWMAQQELAAQADVSHRTVSRWIAKWRKAGLVRTVDRQSTHHTYPQWEALRLPMLRAVVASPPRAKVASPDRPGGESRLLTEKEREAAAEEPRAAAAAPSATPPPAAAQSAAPVVRVGKRAQAADKAPAAPALAPNVVATLQRVPGGASALQLLQRHRLTEPEQQRVLQRVLEVKPAHAGKFVHGPIDDVLADRDLGAEAQAVLEHEWVPDGGPVPPHLKPHADRDVLKPRKVPKPPIDPRVARLEGERGRLAIMPAKHPRRAAQEALVAALEAELAAPPPPNRGGLRLVK